MSAGLTREQADAIYDVLVQEAGAREDTRGEFVHHQTDRYCSEFRFCGLLGFGGKFWRTTGYRADGSWGEVWRVNGYPEDMTPERQQAVDRTNERLAKASS